MDLHVFHLNQEIFFLFFHTCIQSDSTVHVELVSCFLVLAEVASGPWRKNSVFSL